MSRKRKHLRRRKASRAHQQPSTFRRWVLPTLGWLSLGLGIVVLFRPDRLGLLLSGEVAAWRIALFLLATGTLAFAATFLNEMRKRRASRD